MVLSTVMCSGNDLVEAESGLLAIGPGIVNFCTYEYMFCIHQHRSS